MLCWNPRYNFVCLKCKKAKKTTNWHYAPKGEHEFCPHCGKPMRNAGSACKVPRKTDKKGWEDLEFFLKHKYWPSSKKYGSCYDLAYYKKKPKRKNRKYTNLW